MIFEVVCFGCQGDSARFFFTVEPAHHDQIPMHMYLDLWRTRQALFCGQSHVIFRKGDGREINSHFNAGAISCGDYSMAVSLSSE
jgi:hypothetical protein